MRGRAVTAPEVTDNEDGHLVAYVAAEDLMRGLVTGLRDALRTGTPVVLRRSYFTATGSSDRAHSFDMAQVQLKALRRELTAAQVRARRADQAYLSAEDDTAAAKWRAISQKEEASVIDLSHALEAVQAEQDVDACPSDHVEVHGNSVEVACRRLLAGGEYSQQDRDALQTVFPELSLSQGPDGQWTGKAVARLPGAEGSIEIGPFTFGVGSGGYGSQTVRSMLPPPVSADRDRGSRAETLRRLRDAGLQIGAAQSLLNSVFPAMPHVVLWAAGQARLPPWIEDDWHDEAWAAWLLSVYSDPDYRFLGNGQYVRLSPTRQAVVDVVASSGGRADIRALAAAVPTISRATVWTFARLQRHGQHIRPWAPVIDDLGSRLARDASSRVATSRRCPDGHIATIVARIPEMPSNLLCDCGLPVPLEDGGAAPRAPKPYLQLRMSQAHWRAELERRSRLSERSAVAHKPRTLAIPHDPALLAPDGVTSKEMAAAHGRTAADMHAALAKLETQGLVRRSGYRPARWSLCP